MNRKPEVPIFLARGEVGLLLLAGLMALSTQAAVTVAPEEMAQKNQWVQANLLNGSNLPPCSFSYSGQSSASLLPDWTRTETDTVLDTNRTQHVITWDGGTLRVSCVAVEYNDYPMVEWTVYLENKGSRNTPLLENIQGLDVTLSRATGPEFVLHGNKGDFDSADSYEPFQMTLGPSSVNSFSPYSYSGKSCDGPNGWPYYNLEVPGGGMIMAIGWPGEWASSFVRDGGSNLRIEAGQQLTHLVLEPGEKIRTPLIALMFWKGTDVVRSQNLWRHWYMAHEIPRINGQPPSTILQVQGDSTSIVQAYIQAGIQPDILWRDAGWYPHSDGPYTDGLSWLNTGTWEVDPALYPNGFHRTSQQINNLGTKFLLWFEPERVGNTNNSFLATNNPSWLLPQTGSTVGDILNEGDPAVFAWLTNHIQSLIMANGINWYREDMNGDGPLPAWRNNDAPDRQGITENFYVQGHLAYWDALLAMNPGLRIDCCGSGGRRNDLEAMRRGVPLTRSDYNGLSTLQSADGEQSQTYALSSWLPFQGSGTGLFDPYSFRSFYLASFGFNYLGNQVAANQQGYGECKKIAPIILNGDYYPLTPYSLTDTVWMAWQFDWPAKGEGCLQAFRRTNSPVASMTFKLQGLQTNTLYDVQDFDHGDLGAFAGSTLMSNGITLNLQPRQSAVLYYQSIPAPRIQISIAPGQVISLTWSNAMASLQSAASIGGPWTDVTGATSPFAVGKTNNQEFFRLKQ